MVELWLGWGFDNSAAEKVKAASDIQLAELEDVAEGTCCDDDSTGSDGDSEAGGI